MWILQRSMLKIAVTVCARVRPRDCASRRQKRRPYADTNDDGFHRRPLNRLSRLQRREWPLSSTTGGLLSIGAFTIGLVTIGLFPIGRLPMGRPRIGLGPWCFTSG